MSAAWAGDWENARDSFDDRLRPHARRLAEIDAREQGDPADRVQRAEKITRDRIARLTALLGRNATAVKGLANAMAVGSGEASALADVSREQREALEGVLREWGAAGPERRKLRELLAAMRQHVGRAQASLAQAIAAAAAAEAEVAESGLGEALARTEAEAAEAGDRLRARWQREYEARERDRLQRERAAAERERGVR
jgi:excinuclease UvrABC nuclease subunit